MVSVSHSRASEVVGRHGSAMLCARDWREWLCKVLVERQVLRLSSFVKNVSR